ncbi:hypothetical protein LIER_30960 [Lithospermum erythrorhizon]|uniref:Uncharacterized protein n=1 Tax=Lithospermum erythrorhizon TaxID=34254 RepID=A0AAV3RSV6_LITER
MLSHPGQPKVSLKSEFKICCSSQGCHCQSCTYLEQHKLDHSRTGAKLKPISFSSLICSMLITQHPTVLKKEDYFGEDLKSLTISDKLMKGKHVIDMEWKATDQTKVVPEGKAAYMLSKAYKEEQQKLEVEIQAKKVKVSELQAKIQALKAIVPPMSITLPLPQLPSLMNC